MSVQAIVTILVLFQGSDAGLVFRQIASLISFLHEQMKPLPCQQDHFVTGTHLLNDKGAEAFLATRIHQRVRRHTAPLRSWQSVFP